MRCITPALAKTLCSHLYRSIPVLIFQDERPERVLELAEEIGVTHVQLHGNEDLKKFCHLPLTIIKAFRYVPDLALIHETLAQVRYVLLDGRQNGVSADLSSIMTLPDVIKQRMFIAGGLTPENIEDIILSVHPFGIDTASGVEDKPGIKNHATLRAFVDTIRNSPATLP